jgi:predicted double-glycine peptidase
MAGVQVEILQSAGVIVLAIAGALTGVWFSRRKSKTWILGFLLPLILILMVGLPRRHYPLSFVLPFSWLVAGRIEFALVAPLAAMLMATPIARLPNVRMRWITGTFVALFIVQASVLPFLMPAIQRPMLSQLVTRIKSDGVCRQSTDYTCGPAASVTAIHSFGLPAEESEIALLAHTSRATGTEPDVLAAALQSRYAGKGLTFDYRAFHSAAELPHDRPTIALINYKFLVDHYVTVLKATDTEVLIGDPLSGRYSQTFADFERDWRHVGIVVGQK